jgi:ankyrin repeat protein
MLTLRGATLLHVAAEYVNVPLATLLLDRGADVNCSALVDDAGGGTNTIFHPSHSSTIPGFDGAFIDGSRC